jgi:hypothetical protein
MLGFNSRIPTAMCLRTRLQRLFWPCQIDLLQLIAKSRPSALAHLGQACD